MIRSLANGFLTFVLVFVACFTLTEQSAWGNHGVRMLIESDNYRLSRYEPARGTYLGAYVIQDSLVNGDMNRFNDMTGKKHASFFRYVGYGSPFPDKWFEELKEVGAVPHVAWEPNRGLDEVKDDEYLRSFARKLGESGMPVFLRFASEMNGAWPAYTGDPRKYKEKWRLVHDVMEEEAPNVMMVWTIFTFPQNTIPLYYPGDAYVDWVGVNIYNVIYHNNNLYEPAAHEDPLELLDYVYDNYSDRKPIQISEYGATHFTTTDNREYVDFAIQKINRMYNGIRTKYPRVKSIFYFDVNNLNHYLAGRRINNYAVTDNQEVLAAYSNVVSDPHFLSEMDENREGEWDSELFNVKGRVIMSGGKAYVPAGAVEKYMSAMVTRRSRQNDILVSRGESEVCIPVRYGASGDAAFTRSGVTYLPIKAVAEGLGYTVHWDAEKNLITVTR